MSDTVIERLGLPALPDALPRPTTDSHTHLDSTQEFSGLRVSDNIAAAAAVGVHRIVQIGCDLPSAQWSAQLAANNPQVVATVAIHPNDSARMTDAQAEQAWRIIDSLAASGPHVRGVGETGLDYYRTREAAGIARQQTMFARHIATAKAYDRTLVIHDRDAHADIADILDAEGWPERVVMHCFSGDAALARAVTERGWYCSFAGVVTFKNAIDLRAALGVVPRERILVETDAPFLAPAPFRGKPNASYLIPHTMRFMAAELEADLTQLCQDVRANTVEAFAL